MSNNSFPAKLAPRSRVFLARDLDDAKSACRYYGDLPPVSNDLEERAS